MVKILQKREIERLFHVLVAHRLRQRRRKIHGQLLIANGVFQQRLVGGL